MNLDLNSGERKVLQMAAMRGSRVGTQRLSCRHIAMMLYASLDESTLESVRDDMISLSRHGLIVISDHSFRWTESNQGPLVDRVTQQGIEFLVDTGLLGSVDLNSLRALGLL